ncbi:hypothetical protein DSL72_004370 [Monilinia vaccinii-corymbosi]|uniref:Uncharacterized protein n=1 Tax=Monilinia vaccinii-corymbosi TaxID=61207 RepID=A0A8A3NZ35_9HELO|nr:hypothetical protein DSL72_004370 [Monilinia vaccinii-corymbosi]
MSTRLSAPSQPDSAEA